MKTTRTLRILSLVGFLLLFAPFYDSCDGHRIKKAQASEAAAIDTTAIKIDSTKIDTTEISKNQADTISNSVENDRYSIIDICYEFVDDEDSENAFEFAKIAINEIIEFNSKEFKKVIKDEGNAVIFFKLKNLSFAFIVLITPIIFALSFSKKRNTLFKLSILNLVFVLVTIICIFL